MEISVYAHSFDWSFLLVDSLICIIYLSLVGPTAYRAFEWKICQTAQELLHLVALLRQLGTRGGGNRSNHDISDLLPELDDRSNRFCPVGHESELRVVLNAASNGNRRQGGFISLAHTTLQWTGGSIRFEDISLFVWNLSVLLHIVRHVLPWLD